jgi:hypothetical protein
LVNHLEYFKSLCNNWNRSIKLLCTWSISKQDSAKSVRLVTPPALILTG